MILALKQLDIRAQIYGWIYSKERLLVDLIRFRAKYPMDFYKEVVRAYRQITEELDYYDIEEYAEHFSNGENIILAIQLEVL